MDHQFDIFSAQLERAMINLTQASDTPDTQAVLIAAAEIAQTAQKDMSWKKALADDVHREPAIAALDDELSSLQKTILTEIFEGDPEYEIAVKESTPGRLLLDIKRSGKYKARGVKQGFREDKAKTDGPNFDYYSSVVKFQAVRTCLFRDRTGRILAIRDISTAFLQSHKFDEGMHKYICFKHPVTGKWRYYRQSGPIYM